MTVELEELREEVERLRAENQALHEAIAEATEALGQPGWEPVDLRDAVGQLERVLAGKDVGVELEGIAGAVAAKLLAFGDKRDAHTMRWAKLMAEKLRVNAHKGEWFDCDADELLDRVYEEFRELERAERAHRRNPSPTTSRAVRQEAADVANMAMMVADVCESND